MIKQTNSLDEYLLKHAVISSTDEQALSCLFRAVLEPVLEINTESESDVVLKVTNRDLFTGLMTRLEFSEIHYVDYGGDVKGKENLEETDFLLVAASDFVSFLSWKFDENGIKYYFVTNTKEIDKIISLLDENADIDLNYLKQKYHTDKLKENYANACINKLATMLGNTKTDVIEENEPSDKIEFLTKKARYISHEVKNQLSICDLYSGIIKRYCANNNINETTINHAVNCIDKSVKIAGNTLAQLKTLNSKELKLYKTNKLIASAIDLSKAYLENRNIELIIENNIQDEIFVDETLFISTIINLVKNACEAFNDFENNNGWIKVSSKIENDSVVIQVSNNAKPITEPEKIFDEGVTTKSTGSGLGLFICKKNTEEQCGQLNLVKSDEESTVFELKFCL